MASKFGSKGVSAPNQTTKMGTTSPRKRNAGIDSSHKVENPWSGYRAGDPPSGMPSAKMLGDHERGARPGIMHTKGMHLAQAAPDHGPHHAEYARSPGSWGTSKKGA